MPEGVQEKWIEYQSNMDLALKEMAGTQDIEALRESFSVLSDNLYESLKTFGVSGVTVYHQFCPMAFDNKGAYWLSNNTEIINPYFGDEMLHCGSVVETIKE